VVLGHNWKLLAPTTYYSLQIDTGSFTTAEDNCDHTGPFTAGIAITNSLSGTAPQAIHVNRGVFGQFFQAGILATSNPGGPFWQNKDDGAWSIPKGLIGVDEAPLSAARREFVEETGHDPDGDFLPLGEARQPGGKVVQAWAIEGDWDPVLIRSNTFEMEWPPRSGRRRTFPEIDRAAWFAIADARRKILKGQTVFVDRLLEALGPATPTDGTNARSCSI
jgi:predicted NUDIX family NTP pyrophosphohydrolase